MEESVEKDKWVLSPTKTESPGDLVQKYVDTLPITSAEKRAQHPSDVPEQMSKPGECFYFKDKWICKPNKCNTGKLNGPMRDEERYGGNDLPEKTEVKEQLHPHCMGIIKAVIDLTEDKEVGEKCYLIKWANLQQRDKVYNFCWYPRSRIYKHNIKNRQIVFAGDENDETDSVHSRRSKEQERITNKKCKNKWNADDFLKILPNEVLAIGGRLMRVIEKEDREFGAWFLTCDVEGYLREDQHMDNVQFWRIEDFEKETIPSRAIRKVYIIAEKERIKQEGIKKKLERTKQIREAEEKAKLLKDQQLILDATDPKMAETPMDVHTGDDVGDSLNNSQQSHVGICNRFKRRRTNEVDDTSVETTDETDIIQLNVNLKKENAKLKLQLAEKEKTWGESFVGATGQMTNNIATLARQSCDLKSTTSRLERAVVNVGKAEQNIVNRQRRFSNALIPTEKDGITYAWILPKGGRLISSETPEGGSTIKSITPTRSPERMQYSDVGSPKSVEEVYSSNKASPKPTTARKMLQFGIDSQSDDTEAEPLKQSAETEAEPLKQFINESAGLLPTVKEISSPFQQLPDTAFDYPQNKRYTTEEFTEFSTKCKSAMAVKGKLSATQKKDIAFWYYLKFSIQAIFGPNGLYTNNGLPSAPGTITKSGKLAKVRPKDNGDKKIDGELSPHELHHVNYKTYIDAEIEREIVELVKFRKCKPKKKGGPIATDKQKILFGCTRMAQKLLALNKMAFATDEQQLKASIARALYVVNNAPAAAYHVKMWECRRVPWVFAILDCILTNFPTSYDNPREYDELPAAILTNLRNNSLVKKSRKNRASDMSDSDTDMMGFDE